ncbi:MAG: alpha/beta fold hydrolase [Acidobacteriota bacterium]
MHHSIRAIALLLAAAVSSPANAQQPPSAAPVKFVVFVRGTQVGTDEVTVTRGTDGWTIASFGGLGPPLDLVTRNLRIRYDPDWKPLELTIDGTVRNQVFGVHITVSGNTATSHVNNAGQTTDTTDPVASDAVFLPNPFLAAFEAVTPRLKTAASGSTIPVYQAGGMPTMIRVGDSEAERIQTVSRLVQARRTHATLSTGATEVPIEIWADESGRLLRVSQGSQELEYVREDIASVSSRRVVVSRPGDEQVLIPANGFNLAGTLSKATSTTSRSPAIVLVAGSGLLDRDEAVAGIPIFGQLATTLADAGFTVLRYDKRGIGQSGGRAESAALPDYAEDLRAAVKFLGSRKDVDGKRIAIVGYREGGASSLIAAAKDSHIAALVLMGTPGHPGAEVVMAQQKHVLDRSSLSDADKQARVDLQKRIHEAVVTGKGWDALPPQLRRQVDTPEFQSILTFDPAKIMPQVRQPILVVQGALDTQVEPTNADRLAALARSRSKQAPAELTTIPGVNHLFVAASTGEVAEYATLKEKQIDPALASVISSWLRKTLPAAR